MTDAEIEQLIRPTLDKAFGGNGPEAIALRSGEDHDGDPALFLTLRFRADADLPSVAQANAAAAEIDRLLISRGDSRFVHIDYVLPKDARSLERLQSQFHALLRA